MKKNLLAIVVSVSLLGFTACNQSSTKDSEITTADSPTKKSPDPNLGKTHVAPTVKTIDDCDYFVDKPMADSMINKYLTDFHKSSLTKEVWIETCVLTSIKNFLDSNPDYDGVRFFLGRSPMLFSKSILQVIPTIPANSTLPYEKHTNAFGVVIPSCTPSQLKINLPVTEAVEKVNRFGKDFRGETTEGQRNSATLDQLSISIWISRCKIDQLMALYTPESKLDGLMAISAAYYKDDDLRKMGERKHIVQTTLIFVPTKNKKPDWTIIPKPPVGWTKDAGFNHGSLCPQICD